MQSKYHTEASIISFAGQHLLIKCFWFERREVGQKFFAIMLGITSELHKLSSFVVEGNIIVFSNTIPD